MPNTNTQASLLTQDQAIIAQLVLDSEANDSKRDTLDDLVHTAMENDIGKNGSASDDEYDHASLKASEINNGGVSAQIEFLLASGMSAATLSEVLADSAEA